jgi:molybdate transport system permease protein
MLHPLKPDAPDAGKWQRPFLSRLGKTTLYTVSAALMLLLTLPLLALAIRALQTRAWESAPNGGIPQALGLSLLTTAITALITIVLGTPLAYILARQQFRFKRLIQVFIELPVVLPPAVAGLGLLVAFGGRGLFGPLLDELGIRLPFTTAAVVLAQLFVSAPFYVRSAQVGFQGVEREIEDAARVDGADSVQLFLRITLPLSSRALATGLTLSWARALGEFGATILFAGSVQGRTRTMPLLVYQSFEQNINAAIWTGLLLIGMALAAMLAAQWLRHKNPTVEA